MTFAKKIQNTLHLDADIYVYIYDIYVENLLRVKIVHPGVRHLIG